MWQQVYSEIAAPGFEFLAIALDPAGPDAPRPFVEAAGATFPALVDDTGRSSEAFGFKVVPNGVLVERDGTIAYRKEGGFSNANAADLEAVRRFARGDDPGPSPATGAAPYELGRLEHELVATRMAYAQTLASVGRTEAAVEQWQAALRLDPLNLTIRKVIWAVRFPERFHPVIDWAWQKRQLARERKEEISAGNCGPDGCPIPPPGPEAGRA